MLQFPSPLAYFGHSVPLFVFWRYNLPMIDSSPILQILSDAAKKSAAQVNVYFEERLEPQFKSSRQDLVTKADIESQTCIQEAIIQGMVKLGISETEIGFIGEENGLHKKGKYMFAIDPIDGTTNFASGIEYFVISIGCFVDGELMYGVLYEPLTNTSYLAEKGKGAIKIRSNREVSLSIEMKSLKDSMVATYLHSDEILREKELSFVKNIFPSVRGVRMMGAGALDLVKVADNTFQVCMFMKSNIWDIAAATLVIEESGGVIASLTGKELAFELNDLGKIYPVVACHPSNLESVLGFLR